MRNQRQGGTFVVSVDLESDIDGRGFDEHRQLATTCSQLIQLFSKLRIPATWAVADPAQSAATDEILASDLPHELAIAGDATWVGPTAGRTRFSRELFRRTQSARSRGLTATTLALRKVELNDHLDLLVKNGITMIRPSTDQASNGVRLTPAKSLRFGLWQMPASLVIPNASRWLPIVGSFATSHALRRSLSRGQTTLLAIDAPQLAKQGPRGIESVERLLRDVLAIGRKQSIVGKTLGQISTDLAQPKQSVKSHSVLRKTA